MASFDKKAAAMIAASHSRRADRAEEQVISLQLEMKQSKRDVMTAKKDLVSLTIINLSIHQSLYPIYSSMIISHVMDSPYVVVCVVSVRDGVVWCI